MLGHDTSDRCAPMTSRRARNSPGTSMVSPRKSLNCVLAITSAMPLVKPMITGRGMYFTAEPVPVSPITISITPAISVHMNKPSTP